MTEIDRKQLERLVRNSDFEIIYRMQATMVELWNKGTLVGDTEFQTVKNAIERESKISALKEFINTMERVALDKND